jgi:sporulation protein YlmC with PRC-barrel domain
VFGLIGVALIFAAVDVMVGHWLSTPPENNDGVLTTRGQAQQRGDIVWGAAMVGIGTLLVGGAVVELVRRHPIAEVGQAGITLAIGSHEHDVTIPWDAVDSVVSDVVIDPYDGSRRELLVIEVLDRSGIPDDPIGAEWRGDELRVDLHDSSQRVTDVALAAQGALGHHRRVEEIKQMGPPSLTWETTVTSSTTPDGVAATDTGSVGGPTDRSATESRPGVALDDPGSDASPGSPPGGSQDTP